MKAAVVSTCTIVLAFASSSRGQEAPELPAPTKEHQWLHQFVGQWEMRAKAVMAPGQPPVQCQGTMASRSMGGYWIISEVENELHGMKVKAIQTIGYDSRKKQYMGTWVDSMTDLLWQYQGSVDESGKKLTLEAEGPNFMAGNKITKFRDAYEFQSADLIVMSSSMRDEAGNWITFLTGELKRKN